MSNIDDIIKRIDIQLIRSFLINGAADPRDQDDRTYDERIKSAENKLTKLLESVFIEDDRQRAFDEFNDVISANQEIYTEIGMKAGARILFQLLFDDDTTQ